MKFNLIVTGRNDNYGGNFVHRMSNQLRSLAAQCGMYGIDLEYLFVEWAPPANEPRLKDVVPWPENLHTKVITVPEEIHRRCLHADCMNFLAHVAVNAGIRRSTADHILVMGVDIILSNEMASFLANAPMEPNSFYRASRSDLAGDVTFDSLDGLLEQCRSKVRITHGKFDAAGDFILMSRAKWHELHGFQEIRSWGTIDTYMVCLAHSRGMTEVNLPHPIYHQDHNRLLAHGRPQMGWREDVVGVANDDSWGLGETVLETEVIR